jgi:hypothetical protein
MRLPALTLACAVATTVACAQSQEQRNVMTHVGRAVALTNKCPSLKPNVLLVAMVARRYGIDMNRPPDSDFIVARGNDYAKEIAGLDEPTVCALGRKLYGPQGEKVPNFLR